MLITPEKIRVLRREAERLVVVDAIAACNRALVSEPRVEDERACVKLADRWRATSATLLVLDQIHDLTYAAACADDWHAVRILRLATVPDEMHWISSVAERIARGTALAAWNARAARLRAAGIRPWELPDAPAVEAPGATTAVATLP